jgi:hypothetical protein
MKREPPPRRLCPLRPGDPPGRLVEGVELEMRQRAELIASWFPLPQSPTLKAQSPETGGE